MTRYVLQADSARIEVWTDERHEVKAPGWLMETALLVHSFARAWCLCDTTAASERRPIASKLSELLER